MVIIHWLTKSPFYTICPRNAMKPNTREYRNTVKYGTLEVICHWITIQCMRQQPYEVKATLADGKQLRKRLPHAFVNITTGKK